MKSKIEKTLSPLFVNLTLVIIRGLENWRHLLEGTHFKFEIWTDHKNLEYFMKVQKLNHRQV